MLRWEISIASLVISTRTAGALRAYAEWVLHRRRGVDPQRAGEGRGNHRDLRTCGGTTRARATAVRSIPCLIALLVASPALAQVATNAEPHHTAEVPSQPTPDPDAAADVAGAPRPGSESGRTDEVDGGDGPLRHVGRGLLWIPRFPLELIIQPVRGALYVNDRYHAAHVIASWFTTEDKKIAIFPTALIATGFGLNVGAQAQFKDLLGAGERLSLRAGTGGEWRTVAEAKLSIGDKKTSSVAGGVRARYEVRDRDRFYGYGNGDTVAPSGVLIDPTTSDDAIGTLYQLKTTRLGGFLIGRLGKQFAVTGSATFIRDRVSSDDMTGDGSRIGERPIGSFYDTAALPGFGTRDSVYSELEVAWDTRGKHTELDAPGMRSTGGLISAFGGLHENLDDELRFFRGGIDLQRYLPLTVGPRVIELRFHAEAVRGSRGEIPFLELPELGGLQMLRGYDRDRFRDRVAAVAQGGYLFALSRLVAASVFVDVGRVYAGLDELTWRDQRVGFGGAIEIYNASNMVLRTEIAGSIDGSMYLYLSLDPAFDARARTERR